jgi:hypothetical protein
MNDGLFFGIMLLLSGFNITANSICLALGIGTFLTVFWLIAGIVCALVCLYVLYDITKGKDEGE